MQVAYEMRFLIPFLETPDPAKERDDLCKQEEGVSAQPRNRGFNQTWFPGQGPVIQVSIPLSKESIQKAMVDIPSFLFPQHPPKPKYLTPVLLTCIAYRPSFSNATYSTGYILDLLRIDPKTGQAALVVPMEDVPLTYLYLQDHFTTGTSAH